MYRKIPKSFVRKSKQYSLLLYKISNKTKVEPTFIFMFILIYLILTTIIIIKIA